MSGKKVKDNTTNKKELDIQASIKEKMMLNEIGSLKDEIKNLK